MIVYSIIVFATAILFLAFGIAIYKGNTNLIHDYHQTRVEESLRREYGKAFSVWMFVICAALLISGMVALFDHAAISLIVLSVGLTVSIVFLVKVQKKYNGGIF